MDAFPEGLRVRAALGLGLPAFFWAVYQYLFVVFNRSTLGMRAGQVEMRTFDGREPNQSSRRGRALAAALSGLALGMGFAWAFLDEDTLCWHDRITRTYLVLRPR
jgi:hypothetical protein